MGRSPPCFTCVMLLPGAPNWQNTRFADMLTACSPHATLVNRIRSGAEVLFLNSSHDACRISRGSRLHKVTTPRYAYHEVVLGPPSRSEQSSLGFGRVVLLNRKKAAGPRWKAAGGGANGPRRAARYRFTFDYPTKEHLHLLRYRSRCAFMDFNRS